MIKEMASIQSLKLTTTSKDLFVGVNTCMKMSGLQQEKLVSVRNDGCLYLIGKHVGLLKRMQDKVTDINPGKKLLFFHCIIHQELLCKLALKINHVVDVVTKAVNFTRPEHKITGNLLCRWRSMRQNKLIWATTHSSGGSARANWKSVGPEFRDSGVLLVEIKKKNLNQPVQSGCWFGICWRHNCPHEWYELKMAGKGSFGTWAAKPSHAFMEKLLLLIDK